MNRSEGARNDQRTNRPLSGWWGRWLSVCGSDDPTGVLADLGEECARRRAAGHGRLRVQGWRAWQLLGVCVYELRDRGPRARVAFATRELHPVLALRLAARSLWHQPGLAIAAALTLSLGFGAAAAIYSVFAGFGQPLPVPEGSRVVQVRVFDREGAAITGRDVEAWAEGARSVTGIGAFAGRSSVIAAEGVDPQRVSAAQLTPGVFELLGVAPMLGQLPTSLDGDLDGNVVIGHSLWQGVFAADEGIVGRSIRVDGRPRAVAAVMPPGFRFPYQQDLWLPQPAASMANPEAVARRATGYSTAQVAAELQGILRATWQIAGGDTGPRVVVDGFTEERGESGERMALLALLAIVIALLFVSCSNVSNLLLSRALVRSRTLAVHAALGAGPRQVILQMFAEALVVALSGAALGLVAAYGAVRFIEGTLSGHWGYYWMEVAIRPQVLVFVLSLAVAVALVAGTLPALRVGRTGLAAQLRSETAAVGNGLGRVAGLLLTAQVTFSCVAIVIALLMAAGLVRSRSVEPEFPAAAVLVASIALDGDAYATPERRGAFRESVLGDLRDSETIEAAALAIGLPGLNAPIGQLRVEGEPQVEGSRPPRVATFSVTPGFFDVFGIDLLRGRGFDGSDGPGAEPVVIVSEDFAARHLGESEPLGRRISLRMGSAEPHWVRVVGIVADVLIYDSQRDRRRDWVYLPFEQQEGRSFNVTYRARGEQAAAVAELRALVRAVDPDLPVSGIFGRGGLGRVADVLAFVRRIFETAGSLAVIGGVSAALVAMIGLYGVMAFEVQRRVPEIGVRMALGAERALVLRRILRDGLSRLAPGLVLGLGTAYLISPWFAIFLSGVNPRDPMIFSAAAAGYVLVALLASFMPARRAAALDPARILRAD